MSRESNVSAQYFSLRWNNHPANLVSVFSGLYSSETLVDVTLAAEGKHLQAHKMLLSACSEYFQALFAVNPCQHPIVILKDVPFDDLQTVVQFMYNGVVNVSSDKLAAVLKTADTLQIKGLGEKFSESVNQFVSGSGGNSSNVNAKSLSKMASTPRLLSVPSQHSVNSIRQQSTESLPEFLHRQGSNESRQWSVESSASVSHGVKVNDDRGSSPPRHLRKKFRRTSTSFEQQPQQHRSSSPPTIHVSPSRQSSSSTDPGAANPASSISQSGPVVAKKKRELFSSARSSRSGGSNKSSISDYSASREVSFKRESSGSSNQSHSISQSQEEATSTTSITTSTTSSTTTTSNTTTTCLTSSTTVPSTLTIPTERSSSSRTVARAQSAGSIETPTDLSSPRSPGANKRGRFLRRQDCLEKGIDLTTSTESTGSLHTTNMEQLATASSEMLTTNLSISDSLLATPTVRSNPNSPLANIPSPDMGSLKRTPSTQDLYSSMSPFQPLFGSKTPSETHHEEGMVVPNVHLLCPPDYPTSTASTSSGPTRRLADTGLPSVLVTDADAASAYAYQPPPPPPCAIMPPAALMAYNAFGAPLQPPNAIPPMPPTPPAAGIGGGGGGGAPPAFGHCPKARDGPALGCNYCWNTTDTNGRILRRKTKYHCPECQANLCIVPCFQLFHEALEKEVSVKKGNSNNTDNRSNATHH